MIKSLYASGPADTSIAAPPTCADVVERLFLEFTSVYNLDLLSEVIRECRAELKELPTTSSPESLELLARDRLAALGGALGSSRPM
jgi:hypothetical protein